MLYSIALVSTKHQHESAIGLLNLCPLPLEPPFHLLPYSTTLGCHRAPGLSSLSHTENSHLLSILLMVMYVSLGFLVAQRLKHLPASACNVGDLGLIPWSRRSSGEGNGNPLQYSCLEYSMDRGAWWATVHWVTKSLTRLKQLSMYVLD